jgi:hypothetical protein
VDTHVLGSNFLQISLNGEESELGVSDSVDFTLGDCCEATVAVGETAPKAEEVDETENVPLDAVCAGTGTCDCSGLGNCAVSEETVGAGTEGFTGEPSGEDTGTMLGAVESVGVKAARMGNRRFAVEGD